MIVRWSAGRRRGQALVELALMLPVFLFLMMGVIQLAALAMVWISLQGLTQDTARWMAVSSQAAPYTSTTPCATDNTRINYPRPRWANGPSPGGPTDFETYSRNYMDCNLPPILRSANFVSRTWSPACTGTTDCYTSGIRSANTPLTLTVVYDWSNVVFMPGGLRGWLGWVIPANVTVSATEVMQY